MNTLGKYCIKIGSGATPSGGKEAYKGGNYCLVRSQNVLDFEFSNTGLARINDDQAAKLKNVELQKGDVLLNITGDSVARACLLPENVLPARVNQHVAIVRPNPEILDNRYLLYYLQSVKPVLLTMASGGATRNALTKQMLEDLEVSFPPLPEQKRIAAILSSLDGKIENNRKINKNLEEQAQALFKSWFVDFEPFKDGEFVNSELGLIPKGWRIGKIGEVVELLNGFAFKSNSFEEGALYKIITIKGVQDGDLVVDGADSIPAIPAKMPQWCNLQIGDVLLSLTGNVGRCCLVDEENLLLNQRVAKLNPVNPADRIFTYTYFRSGCTKYMLENISKGTAQANLSPVETAKQLIIVPPREVLDDFAKNNCILEQILDNNQESRRLAQLRDTLLPKLMNGEIKI